MNVESKNAITTRVRCQGQLHTIRIDDEQLVLEDHDQEPVGVLIDAADAAADAGYPRLIRCGPIHRAWDGVFRDQFEDVRASLKLLPAPLRSAHADITRHYIEKALAASSYHRLLNQQATFDVSCHTQTPQIDNQLDEHEYSITWSMRIGCNWVGSVYQRLGTGVVQGMLILECFPEACGKFVVRAARSYGYVLRAEFAIVSRNEDGELELSWHR